MNISINTVNGTSKVLYQGLVLQTLTELDLDVLRSQIWAAQQEMALANGKLCGMCGCYGEGITDRVCDDCSVSCEMTCYEYDQLRAVM